MGRWSWQVERSSIWEELCPRPSNSGACGWGRDSPGGSPKELLNAGAAPDVSHQVDQKPSGHLYQVRTHHRLSVLIWTVGGHSNLPDAWFTSPTVADSCSSGQPPAAPYSIAQGWSPTRTVLSPYTDPGSSHQLSKLHPSPTDHVRPEVYFRPSLFTESESLRHLHVSWLPHWTNYVPSLRMYTLLTQSVLILGETPRSSLG